MTNAIATPLSPTGELSWVICLCAAWCGACREYKPVFEQVAQAHPTLRFIWVDIEDEAELVGDIEVETFPTLVIAGERAVRFAGPVAPQAATLSRLVVALSRAHSPLDNSAKAWRVLVDRVRENRL